MTGGWGNARRRIAVPAAAVAACSSYPWRGGERRGRPCWGPLRFGFDRSRWAGLTRTDVRLAAALPLLVCAKPNRIFDLYAVPVWNFERLEQPGAAAWRPS
jgi:hypothetical protein